MKIDMEKAKEEFIKYTGKFNLQDENIKSTSKRTRIN